MQSVQNNSAAQPAVTVVSARSPGGGDAPRGTASPASQVVRSAAPASGSATMASNPAAPNFNPSDMVKRIEQVVDQMREMAKQNNRDLAFDIDQTANRFVIRVTNPTSGELVRQIPTEDILRIAHRIDGMKGIIFEDLF